MRAINVRERRITDEVDLAAKQRLQARKAGSLITLCTMRSRLCGFWPRPHQSGFRAITVPTPGSKLTELERPGAIGVTRGIGRVIAKAVGSRASCCSAQPLDMMQIGFSWSGRIGVGAAVVIRTVWSSTAATAAIDDRCP